jgi:hypothetical protein
MPDNKLPPVPSGMIPVDPPDDTGALPPPPEGLTAVEPPDTYERAPKPYQPGTAKGIAGAFGGGFEQTGRALGAFADVLQGDEAEIIEDAKTPQRRTGAQMRFMQAIEENKDRYGDEDLWQAVKNTAGAVYDEPMGALHEVAAQLPNSGAILASAGAGALAGSAVPGVGTGIGAIVGGALGYLFGNTAIETGFIAQEMGKEGEVDTGKALKQGSIKGGVITGIDLTTMGFNRFLAGAPGKAASTAVQKLFAKAGVDATDSAAVRAAIQANPALLIRGKEVALAASIEAMPKGMKKAALATAGIALESVSEGAGEYLGSKAAGLDASYTEAVMEAMMSLPQSVIETGLAQGLGKGGTPEEAAAGTIGALEAADLVGPRQPEQFGPTMAGAFTPSDQPTQQGYDLTEEGGIEEIIAEPLPVEPIPTADEFGGIPGIDVYDQGPIANLAGAFRERLKPQGMDEAPRSEFGEEIDIGATPVPRETGPSIEAQTDRLWKETAFIEAEIERKQKKQAEEAGIAAIGEQAVKEKKPEDLEAEAKGLREDITRRREEAQAAFTAETPKGMTREEQVDAYIAATDQLDKEEKALDDIEKQREKAKEAVAPEKVAPRQEESQPPLPEVKELPPGVLDEKRPKSGKPYPTKAAAENIRKISKKYADYEVVEADGGFVLQDFGKPPPAPTAEGIEVEELDKIPGPRPKVQPKKGTTGSALGDALTEAGVKTDAQRRIEEQYPSPFGDYGYEQGLEPRPLTPEDEAAIAAGKPPPSLTPQAGDKYPIEPTTNLDGRPFDEEFVGPPREVPGFLERDPDFPMPGRNGEPAEPTPAQAEILRRKAKTAVNKRVKDEGLDPGTPEGKARAKEIRALEGLDDNYDPIQGPPAGGVMGPPEGGAMGPPSGGAMGPPAPEEAGAPPEGGAQEFTPTYELPDGTKVIPVDGEENTYVDAAGDEYIEPNATPITEEEQAVKFQPHTLKSNKEVFGLSEEELSAIKISQEVEGGGTVYPSAAVLLRMSRTRISILNQLGGCVG